MKSWIKLKVLCCSAMLFAAFLASFSASARADLSDLTLEVAGDLLKHGGVVTVYSIKIPADEWAATIAPNATKTVRLDAR